MVAPLLTEKQVNDAFERNIKDIDLVFAKEAPFSSFWPTSTTSMRPRATSTSARRRRCSHLYIDSGIPLVYGTTTKGTATEHSYVEHYDAAEGQLWDAPTRSPPGLRGENLGLNIGDTFFSAHGLKDQTDIHTNKTFTVQGILEPSGSVDHSCSRPWRAFGISTWKTGKSGP